jgi:hypothetical protein
MVFHFGFYMFLFGKVLGIVMGRSAQIPSARRHRGTIPHLPGVGFRIWTNE